MEMGAGIRPAARRRIGWPAFAGVLAVALLAGAGAALIAHLVRQQSTPAPPGAAAPATLPANTLVAPAVWKAGVRPAPNITTLRDQSGRRFSLTSLHGHTVVMEFFDSHCHQECPLAGRALAAAEQSVPRADRPVLVVVSVNPKDTPASARRAAREWGLAGVAPWHWLMGTHQLLSAVWQKYRIYVQPQKGDISHTEALYLIDRHGDERAGFLYPYEPPSVAHDLKVLATSHGGAHA